MERRELLSPIPLTTHNKRHPDPFSHFDIAHMCGPTEGGRMFSTNSAPLAMLIESDVLKTLCMITPYCTFTIQTLCSDLDDSCVTRLAWGDGCAPHPPVVTVANYRAFCKFSVHEQILESTGRCVALSEPNSPQVVSLKYQKFGDSPKLRQLARDVVRWECRPYPTMQPPPLAYVLKLRHECISLLR